MSYDPWGNVTTRNGIQGDLVISALQKSIRRGLEEEAVTFAYEMYITSEQFEEKLWRRLLAISVEDVGFGDSNAPVVINAINQIRKNFPYADGDRPLFFVHAIRYPCHGKERSHERQSEEHRKTGVCPRQDTRNTRFRVRQAYQKGTGNGTGLQTLPGRRQPTGE